MRFLCSSLVLFLIFIVMYKLAYNTAVSDVGFALILFARSLCHIILLGCFVWSIGIVHRIAMFFMVREVSVILGGETFDIRSAVEILYFGSWWVIIILFIFIFLQLNGKGTCVLIVAYSLLAGILRYYYCIEELHSELLLSVKNLIEHFQFFGYDFKQEFTEHETSLYVFDCYQTAGVALDKESLYRLNNSSSITELKESVASVCAKEEDHYILGIPLVVALVLVMRIIGLTT